MRRTGSKQVVERGAYSHTVCTCVLFINVALSSLERMASSEFPKLLVHIPGCDACIPCSVLCCIASIVLYSIVGETLDRS